MIVFAQKSCAWFIFTIIIITPRQGGSRNSNSLQYQQRITAILDEFAAGIGGQAAVQVIDDVIVRPEERDRAVFSTIVTGLPCRANSVTDAFSVSTSVCLRSVRNPGGQVEKIGSARR